METIKRLGRGKPFGCLVIFMALATATFAGPRLHFAFLDENIGRLIYIDPTYTVLFAGETPSTPYYEYNQIMYRLTLDDARISDR